MHARRLLAKGAAALGGRLPAHDRPRIGMTLPWGFSTMPAALPRPRGRPRQRSTSQSRPCRKWAARPARLTLPRYAVPRCSLPGLPRHPSTSLVKRQGRPKTKKALLSSARQAAFFDRASHLGYWKMKYGLVIRFVADSQTIEHLNSLRLSAAVTG